MAVLPALLHAQTPSRPAVNVRQLPSMFRSVWPADFNGDGRMDLVAGEGSPTDSSFRRVVVRLGNGNGTFGAAIATGAIGIPVSVGDFDRDGAQDVVVVGVAGAMSIVEGNGNGTFGTIHALDPTSPSCSIRCRRAPTTAHRPALSATSTATAGSTSPSRSDSDRSSCTCSRRTCSSPQGRS